MVLSLVGWLDEPCLVQDEFIPAILCDKLEVPTSAEKWNDRFHRLALSFRLMGVASWTLDRFTEPARRKVARLANLVSVLKLLPILHFLFGEEGDKSVEMSESRSLELRALVECGERVGRAECLDTTILLFRFVMNASGLIMK